MLLILSVFGVALGTAVLPVFSLELYLVAVVAANPELPWLGCALAAASGQLLGKSVHYLAARGLVRLPRLLGRHAERGSRWARRFRDRCLHHPYQASGVVLASAFSGIPPFGGIVVVAGLVRAPLVVLVPAGVVGRIGRFCVLAAAPAVLHSWSWLW